MILVRIILLIFFILSGIISLYHNLIILFLVALFGFIMTIVWVLMKDYNIDIDGIIENMEEKSFQKLIEKDEKKELEEKIKLENKRKYEEEKNEYKVEFKQESSTIVIDTNKLIIFLLIVIIIILLYTNGIFFKFTVITKENINDIITSSYLTQEEKQTLTYKLFIKEDNEIYGKMIWQLL